MYQAPSQITLKILTKIPQCYIGLTQWQHSAWQDSFLQGVPKERSLSCYAHYFSSVEGNTTFYGLPKKESIDSWKQQTEQYFRFCFKFPQEISHKKQLLNCETETLQFLKRIETLEDKLGVISLQLPASFSPQQLDNLGNYLSSLPKQFNYAVEVRHNHFFDKGENEQNFLRLLQQYNVDRVVFDTRALFAHPAKDEISLRAKEHKPQLPVHASATSNNPFIRFITPLDWQWGTCYLEPWIKKTSEWLQQGRSPYFFFHTPDNANSPCLAKYFAERLQQQHPDQVLFHHWEQQLNQEALL